jgi:hypothetical protein
MSIDKDTEHPSEEALIGFALGEGQETVATHVQACARCRRYVEDLRQVKAAVASLDEEDPPGNLHEHVLDTVKRSLMVDAVQAVLRNPATSFVLLGVFVVLYVILMYVSLALLL